MIDVQTHSAPDVEAPDGAHVSALYAFLQRELDVRDPVEVSVSFVDDEDMRELNSAYRGIDRTTDVLSFECDGVDDGFPAAEGGMRTLGDIIVSPTAASAQAPEHGNTPEREMDLLMIHGFLHLLGYDHIEDDDAAVMEPLQDELLEKWTSSDGIMEEQLIR